MSLDDHSFSIDHFSGTVRLFPLPNLIVFPHVMQPLHIFEPRYQAMLEDSLAGDRMLAMALLSPGWENDYQGRPGIRSTACLCKVAKYQRTEQETYQVLLVGLRRIQILKELAPRKMYREAKAKIVDDVYPAELMNQRDDLRKQLIARFRKELPKRSAAQDQFAELLTAKIDLGMLTDLMAFTLSLNQNIKEELLAQPVPILRALLLLKYLNVRGGVTTQGRCSRFPPEFSLN